jgi:hypothetical protein
MINENIDKLNNIKEKTRKEPKIIEIRGRMILDVSNKEGALIESDKILFVDTKTKEGEEEPYIKELEDIDGVTSHGYMGCAEIVGELSNGDRFYFHSRDPFSFKIFIEKILSLIKEEDVTINDIKIRGEFGRNASRKEDKKRYADSEMRGYQKICDNLKIAGDSVEIKEESIVGSSREKVVGRSWIEDR